MLSRPFFILFLLLIAGPALAQPYLTEKEASGKARKLFEEARSHLNAGRGTEAIETLEKTLSKEPRLIDAQLMYADLLLQRKDYPAAETGFEKALELGPDYAPLAYFLVAEAEYQQKKFGEALTHLNHYLTFERAGGERRQQAEQLKANAAFALQATADPVPFQPVRLSEGVNTELPEYLPSLTADERLLVFTRRLPRGNEDIFYSQRTDSAWQAGQPLPGLNTAASEVSPSISADGKLMVFTSNLRNQNFDLYYSENRNGHWTEAQLLPPPVSTNAWESQPSLSADGRELYFASDRPGGRGRLDLWVSQRQPDGAWSKPRNLGPTINTPLNEQAPFIHPDGQTLYFMSKGHPGMGQYDLYLSRRQDDGNWGPPFNLGYPINTIDNEGALIVSMDGRTAYFDTDKLGPTGAYQDMGNADLYSFELYPAARPQPAIYVQAIVRDARTRRPLVASVDFVKLSSGQRHVQAQTDEAGEFLVVLPAGEDYALNVSKPGYLFHSENFALAGVTTLTAPFRLEIYLTPLPEPETVADAPSKPVILKNVFFETGSAALRPESRTELNRLRDLLKDNPGLRIRINGHTDDVGTEADNRALSENRAKAVYDYLTEEGIDPERLRYKGFGESRPITPNDSPEGRQQNRRTEFEIMAGGKE